MSSDDGKHFIRQLAITSPEEWQQLTAWYQARGISLAPIPSSSDGIATYSLVPPNEQDPVR